MDGQPTPVRLSIVDAARRAGVQPATWRAYVARAHPKGNPAPQPDGREALSGAPYWLVETVDDWIANRPGRGARSDLTAARPVGRVAGAHIGGVGLRDRRPATAARKDPESAGEVLRLAQRRLASQQWLIQARADVAELPADDRAAPAADMSQVIRGRIYSVEPETEPVIWPGDHLPGPVLVLVLSATLNLRAVTILPLSRSARPAIFRPTLMIDDQPMVVLVDRIGTVDVSRLAAKDGHMLEAGQLDLVEEAVARFLGVTD